MVCGAVQSSSAGLFFIITYMVQGPASIFTVYLVQVSSWPAADKLRGRGRDGVDL